MVVSTHARNEDNILAIRHIGAREVLEVPYHGEDSIIHGVIFDIDDFLGRRWWSTHLRLCNIIRLATEPVLETHGSNTGIWDYDIGGFGGGKVDREVENNDR
jgi:hypothetical protein